MNKSSLLLLPTVLAVSASARTKSSNTESPRTRPASKSNHELSLHPAQKNISIDFVFTVSK